MSEADRRNYPVDHLINNDIVPGLLAQWRKANTLFTGPVINTEVRIRAKVKHWNEASSEGVHGQSEARGQT
ncbi:putative leucine zipper transcription factor-like protein 1-like 11 [Homarus americanus]|uniref:Putative leucine zipper transcription factor-like protein 1-like 11 n=1 Tax=Homarus americanus TaxID=6706 RepID=A0A8J5JY22_HOMAM|nr:putative leucine zipper transcription factor-like protein 1-like 11 [Homarus americanus]